MHFRPMNNRGISSLIGMKESLIVAPCVSSRHRTSSRSVNQFCSVLNSTEMFRLWLLIFIIGLSDRIQAIDKSKSRVRPRE